MAQWIELKPDRTLLDNDFEGYRLSLEKLQCTENQLCKELDVVNLPSHQYSLQHVKTYSSHNHLGRDRWNENILYFISSDLSVFSLCDSTEASEVPVEVFQVDDDISMSRSETLSADQYNPTLSFPSANLALLSDGGGNVALLETDSREQQLPWKVIYIMKKCNGLIIHDSLLIHSADSAEAGDMQHEKIIMVTGHVEETTENKYSSVINTITLTPDGSDSWVERSIETYNTHDVEYISLDDEGSLYIASSSHTFTEETTNQEASDNTETENGDSSQRYIWLQADDDITVTFALPDNTTKSDIQVVFSHEGLSVTVKEKQLLTGNLLHPISPGECTWTIADENKRLDIYVSKCEPSWWTHFIPDNDQGEMITDPDIAERIQQNLDYLTADVMDRDETTQSAVNNQQLEECDTLASDATYLCKVTESSPRKPVHVVNFTGSQWLFNMPAVNKQSASFCTRHDVDGLVWNPTSEKDEFPYKHTATFNALGYVQASKVKRRFISAPSDYSYVAIADTDRHIYVYRQPSAINTDLRNRKTGRKTKSVSTQQLISLENTDSIYGLSTTRNAVYVLTKSTLYRFCI